MTSQYKVMCGCECFISSKIMHSSLLSWCERFWKNLNIISIICTKQKVWWKCLTVYLRHIKILPCQMESICFRTHLICQWQQFIHMYHQNIHYQIVNLFCIVVRNVQGLIFQVHNQISTINMLVPPYVFMCINTFQFALCMVDAISMKINSVHCLRLL